MMHTIRENRERVRFLWVRWACALWLHKHCGHRFSCVSLDVVLKTCCFKNKMCLPSEASPNTPDDSILAVPPRKRTRWCLQKAHRITFVLERRDAEHCILPFTAAQFQQARERKTTSGEIIGGISLVRANRNVSNPNLKCRHWAELWRIMRCVTLIW